MGCTQFRGTLTRLSAERIFFKQQGDGIWGEVCLQASRVSCHSKRMDHPARVTRGEETRVCPGRQNKSCNIRVECRVL